MEGHIFIYGYISPYQDNDPGMWGEVNMKYVQNQIQNQSKAETLVVHINSLGGDVDEGFGIYDILRASGKKIITQIEGMCASIATVIALAGDERRMTENAEFMIHCPMADGGGTASDFQQQADMMQAVEDKVINFYAEKTGGDKEKISEFMKAETYMPPAQAKALGFITGIITTMKAVARINLKNNIMSQAMTEAEFDKKTDKRIKKFMKKMGLSRSIKMITVTTADGTILDFGEDIQEESQIAIGTTATVDGAVANGDYVLADGRTLVFVDGAVTEIKDAEAEASVEELKKQIADKDAEIAALTAAQAKAERKLKAKMKKFEAKMTKEMKKKVEAELKTFKATMKSDMGVSSSGERGSGEKIRKGEKA